MKLNFPIVKNIHPRTIADDLEPLSNEETAKRMKEIFDKVEELSGYKVVVKGDTMPTRVLIPKENIEI